MAQADVPRHGPSVQIDPRRSEFSIRPLPANRNHAGIHSEKFCNPDRGRAARPVRLLARAAPLHAPPDDIRGGPRIRCDAMHEIRADEGPEKNRPCRCIDPSRHPGPVLQGAGGIDPDLIAGRDRSNRHVFFTGHLESRFLGGPEGPQNQVRIGGSADQQPLIRREDSLEKADIPAFPPRCRIV